MTTQSLKLLLAKCLPKKLMLVDMAHESSMCGYNVLCWHQSPSLSSPPIEVKDTELLHICWLVEQTLTKKQMKDYMNALVDIHCLSHDAILIDITIEIMRSSWQQRATALHKVLGKEKV